MLIQFFPNIENQVNGQIASFLIQEGLVKVKLNLAL